MFTGLIQDVGTVERISFGAMAELWIRAFAGQDLKLGESIAIDGTCLTVAEVKRGAFRVEASPETLRRTTIGSLEPSGQVNLERAMALGDRLGGHLVLGHVDAVCQILSIREEGGSRWMEFSLPPLLAPMFVEKGSVALDGISLTVNELGSDRFSVAIIPETLKRTALAAKRVGSGVNVEADLIGKYIARLYSLGRAGRGGSAGISEEIPPAAGFGPRG
jgi:riboflavin synthase